jgi:hypothetical protein
MRMPHRSIRRVTVGATSRTRLPTILLSGDAGRDGRPSDPHSPAQPTALPDPRPDLRRAILIGVAVAAASLGWVTAALAQGAGAYARSGEESSDVTGLVAHRQLAAELPVVGPRLNTTAIGLAARRQLESDRVAVDAPLRLVQPPLSALARSPERGATPIFDEQNSNATTRQKLALIGVGLGAVVIGSVVDGGAGTIIVLGGAGLSLYGFYQILR